MIFRLRKPFELNWRYAIGEIVIVVVGILIALALDNWRDGRIARRLETQYLDRLTEDLVVDTATYSFIARGNDIKLRALSAADSVLRGDVPVRDTIGFLQALVTASNFSWNQPALRTTTFEELQSTGNLRLIRDTDLRAAIVRYYNLGERDYNRVNNRRTEYGPLTYQYLPRKSEFVLDTASVRPRLRSITAGVLASDLGKAITAERNIAQFFMSMTDGLRERALELLTLLEAARNR